MRTFAEADQKKLLLKTVTGLGVATAFINEHFIPASHLLVGRMLRDAIAAGIVFLVVYYAKTICRRLSREEKIVMLAAIGAGLVAIACSLAKGQTPDLIYFSKIILFDIAVYALAKLLPGEESARRYFRILYVIALIASLQAVIALFADLYQVYYIGETVVHGIGEEWEFIFPFWGLVGAHAFMRAFWYFGESAYFTQFLIIALGYAIARRRYLGIAIITAGALASFAVASMAAGAVMLIAIVVISRGKLLLPVLTVFATVLALYLSLGNFYGFRARQGITNNVLSVRVIQDLKNVRKEIALLTRQRDDLRSQLMKHSLSRQERMKLDAKLQAVTDALRREKIKYYGNLRQNNMNLLMQDMQDNAVPASQLIPSDDALYRGASFDDKLHALKTAWCFFLAHPLGGGMKEPPLIMPDINTSPGWTGLTLTFGGLWLAVLIPMYVFMIKGTLSTSYDPFLTTMIIALGSVFLATFWHGPHVQYSMMFMLSLLVSLFRNRNHQAAATG